MQDATRVEQRRSEFAGFDERARNTMYAARDEARARTQVHVGTEHVLVGLLRDSDCVARRALGDLGVDVSTLADRARTIVPPGDTLIAADPTLSPRAKKALTLAVEEGRRLKAKNIGTEHLLVGLLATGEGMAYAALSEAGVTLAAVRAAIQRHRATG